MDLEAKLAQVEAALAASQAEVERLKRGINVVAGSVMQNGGEASFWLDNLVNGREWNADIPAPLRVGTGNTQIGVCGTSDPRGCDQLQAAKECFASEKRRADSAIARERALRAALTSLRDTAVVAQMVWMEGDNGEDQCLKAMIDEADAALSAPSPACPSCERMRDVDGPLMDWISDLLLTRRTENCGIIGTNQTARMILRHIAALAHAEGTHETKEGK